MLRNVDFVCLFLRKSNLPLDCPIDNCPSTNLLRLDKHLSLIHNIQVQYMWTFVCDIWININQIYISH